MKKIFTLAAAVLASFSLWAALPLADIPEGTTAFSAESDWGSSVDKNKVIYDDNNYFMMLTQGNPLKFDEANGIKIGNSSKPSAFVFHLGATADLKLIVGQNGSTSAVSLLYLGEETEELTADNIANGKQLASVEVSSDASPLELSASACAPGYYKVHGSLRFCFKSIEVSTGAAPSTDPVATVTLSGDAEAYVGETVTVTASTDVKANAFQWLVNDAVQDGAEAAKFDFKADAAGTYNIVCKAKNDYNEDWVASAPLAVVVTEKTVLEQVEIDGPTVWDWTKAASVKEIKWTGEQKDAEPVLLANVEGMNNNQDFNSQALLFSGEYPVRDSKLCQGHTLIFKTKVAGYVQVVFSNTGTKDDPRYVAVNDVVNTEVGSLNTKEVESAFIPVEAGEVRINGAFADGTRQYLRIYKVTFGVGEIPTALINTDAEVKAVKVIRNGQLLIEKNGVLYNAQGNVVK